MEASVRPGQEAGGSRRLREAHERVLSSRSPSIGASRRRRRASRNSAMSTAASSSAGKSRALISVFDKDGVVFLGKQLEQLGYEVVSTGGSARALEEGGVQVTQVEALTRFPEMLEGRVKTLHPAIHGGILADRRSTGHMNSLREQGIAPVDVVVGNLYPFSRVALQSSDYDECIENIDIGGPSLLRAAAKNHDNVLVVVDPSDYERVAEHLQESREGTLDESERKRFQRELAWKAFQHTATYDSLVAEWMFSQSGVTGASFPSAMTIPIQVASSLRYGENPHQEAAFYKNLSLAQSEGSSVGQAILHHGKEMSHNNYLDADAAFECVCDLPEPACAIIKHTNPCGAATKEDIAEAYRLAVQADPVSAFGGIVAFNTTLTEEVAREIREFRSPLDGETRMFYEIVIAPSFTEGGLEVLKGKSKNLRIVQANPRQSGGVTMRQIGGGFLVQTTDDVKAEGLTFERVGKATPRKGSAMGDVRLAWNVVKHVKSNAIAIAKDGRLLGVGSGQPNRVKSAEIALEKAGEECQGASMASDAFFPFSWNDSVEMACKAGVESIAHPGGSIRDNDAVECCDHYGVALFTTGIRHFRH